MCVIEQSPVIETRRLVLRSPETGDAPAVAAICRDLDVSRMTLRMPHPYGLADAEAWVTQAQGSDPRRDRAFVITEEDGEVVGLFGFFHDRDPWPELGYAVGRRWWGRGYATEALEGAVAWARRSWRRRALGAGHFEDNPASGRVLEKAGFLYTGERRRLFSRARGAEVSSRVMVWLA